MTRTDLYALLSHVATGVSLFVTAAGAMWAFIVYLPLSFLSAVAAAVVGMVPGIFLLLIAEGFFILTKIHREKQTQTELLRDIRDRLAPEPAETDA